MSTSLGINSMGRDDQSVQTRLALVENRLDEHVETLKDIVRDLKSRVATLEKLVFIGFGIIAALQVIIPILLKLYVK